MTHDIDDLVVSWLVRGSGLSEELARDVVAEIRWTERREVERLSSTSQPPRADQMIAAAKAIDLVMAGQRIWNATSVAHALLSAGYSIRLDCDDPELLSRLDSWDEDENPGPLIRWAAAHLRGCVA